MATLWITGGTGFLGSHIIRRFIASGHSITILKRTSSIVTRLDDLRTSVRFIDLDRDDVRKLMFAEPPDVVIHCATDYGRKPCARSDIVEANLLMPLRLLEIAIESGVKTFMNTDTFLDKGVSAYSLSKKHFRDWLAASSDRIACVNVILEHFYGPTDDPTKFVSLVVKSLLEAVAEIPLTPGMQQRDFIHIDDVVSAFAVIEKAAAGYGTGFYEFEIGTGKTISIRDFVGLVKELTGNTRTKLLFGAIPYRSNEVMNAKVNLTRILELGWRPMIDLRSGIQTMICEEQRQ